MERVPSGSRCTPPEGLDSETPGVSALVAAILWPHGTPVPVTPYFPGHRLVVTSSVGLASEFIQWFDFF